MISVCVVKISHSVCIQLSSAFYIFGDINFFANYCNTYKSFTCFLQTTPAWVIFKKSDRMLYNYLNMYVWLGRLWSNCTKASWMKWGHTCPDDLHSVLWITFLQIEKKKGRKPFCQLIFCHIVICLISKLEIKLRISREPRKMLLTLLLKLRNCLA